MSIIGQNYVTYGKENTALAAATHDGSALGNLAPETTKTRTSERSFSAETTTC
jgi:hypothetical protein